MVKQSRKNLEIGKNDISDRCRSPISDKVHEIKKKLHPSRRPQRIPIPKSKYKKKQ